MNTNRVLEVGRKWLGLTALALCLAGGSAHAQVGALSDQSTSQEAEGNVVIWINNTEGGNDDVMPIGGSLPCTIKLTGAEKDMTVVLVAPKVGYDPAVTRLALYEQGVTNNSDGSLTVTLLKSGAAVEFSIGGASGSKDVGDGKIEAHKDSATGTIKKTEDASVYWFQSPHMFVLQGAEYKLRPAAAPTEYTAEGVGVYLRAQLELMPLDVPTVVPELATLGIGIVQNAKGGTRTNTWHNPSIEWTTSSLAGDTVTKGEQYSKTTRVTVPTTDVPDPENPFAGSTAPLYSRAVPIRTGLNTAGDTPSQAIDQPTKLEAAILRGNVVAVITYQDFLKAEISEEFEDWCVTYDIATEEVKSVLKQNSWELKVNSLSMNQKATVGQDHGVTSQPLLSTTWTSNDEANKPENTTKGPSGTPRSWTK